MAFMLQSNWRYCSKCRGLWFGGQDKEGGVCPAGGAHISTPSGDYVLLGDQDGVAELNG